MLGSQNALLGFLYNSLLNGPRKQGPCKTPVDKKQISKHWEIGAYYMGLRTVPFRGSWGHIFNQAINSPVLNH